MKSIAQLLLYPYKVCGLPIDLVKLVDPTLMTVPSNILDRLSFSDRLIGVPNKNCTNSREAAKWLIAEAVIYERMTCVYIKDNHVVYMNNLSDKQSFLLNKEKTNEDYLDKLRASYLIRWGGRILDFPGEYIKVIDIENNEHLTTPTHCDCLDFEKTRQCEHISLVKIYLNNRRLLSFIET